jgi:hypothetical protein
MSDFEAPRKVDASEIEILGTGGETIRESDAKAAHSHGFSYGNVKVFKGGPALLLFLPLLIPIAILAFFLMAVAALFFGKSVFKLMTAAVRRR